MGGSVRKTPVFVLSTLIVHTLCWISLTVCPLPLMRSPLTFGARGPQHFIRCVVSTILGAATLNLIVALTEHDANVNKVMQVLCWPSLCAVLLLLCAMPL